ncbi:hypothetical protein SPRG_06173 [Saprolegnia parasitica CBS 223.65]|uniref:Phosphatidylinositol-3,4-bisphosphate 4-phosphatase n=1 Tax=Saprolegnia parasitica (strain CBS 223.65) TaxID=695850 RepID=A0A067CQP1_SAPPC|nr:hypothetical protein SPRG_06173 [Saprolegnia parasitica CBS 223.65]KDO29117.1 hypothetical protein SPRG_06173 [Saprolegnia parasitica CBS 223.65]|eukprot:XP_012200283.1 hypothetical protein SPRG_06173 [Saprolegnia parasitica CBS 223.65]
MSVLGTTAGKAKLPECTIQVEIKAANRAPLPQTPRYSTEKVRSRNPAFVIGLTLELPATTPPDSLVCFNVVLTEEGASGKVVAHTDHGASSVYLPLTSAVTDAAVLTLRFARVAPLSHSLLETQNEIIKCYAFPSATNPLHHLPTLVSEELAEVGPSVQMPLLFLRHCRRELEGAYHLWRVRYNNARKRLKHFADGDDALRNGCDVFRVSVVAARNLSVPFANVPRKTSPVRPPHPLSPREMLKKQYSPKRGSSSDDALAPRCGVHPFVMVLFNETESAATPLQQSPWHLVGRTNTEYESLSPRFGTNQNVHLCPHGSAASKHSVASLLHTKADVEVKQGAKQIFLSWFRPSRQQVLSGALQWDVYGEAENDGQSAVEIGQVFISLNDLRPLMTPETRNVVPNALSLHTAMWVPILNRQQEPVGELYLDLQIRLTSTPFVLESEHNTHASKPGQAKADDTPLFRLASSTMDRALRETMAIPSDQEHYSIGFLHAHVMELDRQVKELAAMIRTAETRQSQRLWFKGSGDKKKRDVQAFATNLHVSYLRKYAWPAASPRPGVQAEPSQFDLLGLNDDTPPVVASTPPPSMENPTLMTYATVTCGAPTAHALGLDDQGLVGLEDKLVRVKTQIALVANGVKNLHSNVMVEGGVATFERPVLVPVDDGDDVGSSSNRSSTDAEAAEKHDESTEAKAASWSLAAKARKTMTKTLGTRLTRHPSDETIAPSALALREAFEACKYQYYFRKCVCVSQAVSALVTSFLASLELHMETAPEILHQWASIGYLIGWESLISSQGKELTMLSDAWATIKCLERFAFQLDDSIETLLLEETGANHEGYVIRIPCLGAPKDLGLIRVTSVLFTQGINEMQSLANMVGTSGVELQSTINNASFQTLQQYHAKYLGLNVESDRTTAQLLLDPLMAVVQAENAAAKNTRILLEASDAVRRMNGGRVTYCKSGKDRTAMSVTLDQARLLFKRANVQNPFLVTSPTHASQEMVSHDELAAANLMREYGVRIVVAKKNVGRFKYSFNSIQRKLLPELYRPPTSTIQDMVTSVTARDS